MKSSCLDPSPIQPPLIRSQAAGFMLRFSQVVVDAGMLDVVTHHETPEIRVHAGPEHFKVPVPGRRIYCVGGAGLPVDRRDRAREILRVLAYGFLDWGAREVVARHHRDVRRAETARAASAVEGGSVPAVVRLRRFLTSNPGATIGEMAKGTGIAQPNVSRQIARWKDAGLVDTERSGRETRCRLAGSMVPRDPSVSLHP